MSRTHYGLGRHVEHDPRSIAFAVPAWPKSAISAVSWTRRAAIFDQGQLGSCTGNAGAGLVGTDASGYTGQTSVTISGNALSVDESLAVQVYSLATQLDDVAGAYPPDDTGSSGIGSAKALVKLGLATGYQHAFSMAALNTALQKGPVMIGIEWLNSMFDPNSSGVLQVTKNSGVAGGHEFVVSAYDPASGLYRMDNSWGTGWGVGGSAYFKTADLQWLLSQQGDVTQPTFAAAPVPTPPPTPTPTPVPTDVDAAFWTACEAWAAAKGFTG